MIRDYRVIDAWDADETKAMRILSEKVLQKLIEGYAPIGGVAITLRPPLNGSEHYWLVAQAMVLERK